MYKCPLSIVAFLHIKLTSLRTQTTDVLPQLDDPTSVCARRRPEQEHIRRTAMIPRGEYPDESGSDSYDNRRSHDG